MKDLLRRKKGVSLMIGYVLLVAIGIALSLLVFAFLKLYVPSEKPGCYEGVELGIEEIVCEPGTNPPNIQNYGIRLKLKNRGLFSVDSVYVKVGEEGSFNKITINDPNERLSSLCNDWEIELKPGDVFCESFAYNPDPNEFNPMSGGERELTIEPVVWIDNKPVLCTDSVIKKKFYCLALP
jgi:hypothetical protein